MIILQWITMSPEQGFTSHALNHGSISAIGLQFFHVWIILLGDVSYSFHVKRLSEISFWIITLFGNVTRYASRRLSRWKVHCYGSKIIGETGREDLVSKKYNWTDRLVCEMRRKFCQHWNCCSWFCCSLIAARLEELLFCVMVVSKQKSEVFGRHRKQNVCHFFIKI